MGRALGEAAQDLLSTISERVASHGSVRSLDGARYMAGHIAFEGNSDQQARILRWLVERLVQDPRSSLDVASIGAGSGILDVPLIDAVRATKPIRYTVVEPFEEQCAAFAKRAAALLASPDVTLEIRNEDLAAVPETEQFDLVLAIHSIYYVPDLGDSIRKLLRLTRPGGELVLAVAPCEAMNQLAEIFWRTQLESPIWFLEDVERELAATGVAYRTDRIDSHLDFELDHPSLADIANFLVHAPLDEMGPELGPLVLEYLHEVGRKSGSRLAVPHPVEIVRITR